MSRIEQVEKLNFYQYIAFVFVIVGILSSFGFIVQGEKQITIAYFSLAVIGVLMLVNIVHYLKIRGQVGETRTIKQILRRNLKLYVKIYTVVYIVSMFLFSIFFGWYSVVELLLLVVIFVGAYSVLHIID